MKKIIVLVNILLFSVMSFGQNGLTEGDYFLLYKSNSLISLNIFEEGVIKEKAVYPITVKSIFTTDQKYRVAILDTANNNISLFEIGTSKEVTLTIPFDLIPKTVLLNDDNLFIGGEMGEEMLVQYHFKSEKWFKLEIPEKISFEGKAVDDLVVNDSLLIAVDNLIMPKYVLFYKLNPDNKLAFSHFELLKSNGPYESIHYARITEKYFGLLSITFFKNGANEYITIYDHLNLLKSFAISLDISLRKGFFNDFLIVEDFLIIADEDKGLGILEIKPSYFSFSEDQLFDFNSIVSQDEIKYTSFNNKNIIKLTIIPNTNKIVLTFRDNLGKIGNIVFEI